MKFDPSARPCVPLDIMTMAFPMKKFKKVIEYMEGSPRHEDAGDSKEED